MGVGRGVAETRDFDKSGTDISQGVHQPLDGLLHLENNLAAACGHQRCVPAELNGVAEALLGVEQDAPPEKGLALPAGHAETPRDGMDLTKLPSGLIIVPAALPLTESEASESEIVSSTRLGGIGFNRLLVGAQGLRHPAQIEERVAAIGRRGPAAEKLSAVKDGDGLSESAVAVKQDAMHVDGFSVAGVTQEGPTEPGPGAGEILLSGAKLAPGNEGFNLCGIEGESSAEVRLTSFRVAPLALENRKVDPAGNEVWT